MFLRILKSLLLSCLNTGREWHALIVGFECGFLFWWPDREAAVFFMTEIHYFLAGKCIGFIAFVWFAVLISRVVS